MTTCEDSRPTPFGWPTYCTKPAGHTDRPHESADFYWNDADQWASIKERPA